MNTLDDFASCGFCGKVVYLPRISAPARWKPEEVRAKIALSGIGPGVCPECGKASKFTTRRQALEIEEARKRTENEAKTEGSAEKVRRDLEGLFETAFIGAPIARFVPFPEALSP